MSPEEYQWQVTLWDAINRYVVTCGGDPSKHVHGNMPRMAAVASVCDVVRSALARAGARPPVDRGEKAQDVQARSEGEFWALAWREGENWAWVRRLDGNHDECTTDNPACRLRYSSRESALSAKWRFRASTRMGPDEKIVVVHVRVVRREQTEAKDV